MKPATWSTLTPATSAAVWNEASATALAPVFSSKSWKPATVLTRSGTRLTSERASSVAALASTLPANTLPMLVNEPFMSADAFSTMPLARRISLSNLARFARISIESTAMLMRSPVSRFLLKNTYGKALFGEPVFVQKPRCPLKYSKGG